MVDTETMLVVVPQVTRAANDKQQLTPMLERLGELPQDLPNPAQLTADAGCFSEANVDACEQARSGPPQKAPACPRPRAPLQSSAPG